MDYEGLKQGAGRANLRKKEKTNGLVGAKSRGGGVANLREKGKKNDKYGPKTGGRAGQTKEKREKECISGG